MDSRRNDKWHNLGSGLFKELVAKTSKHCFSPLTVGGGIKSLDDFKNLFDAGADKCCVNSLLYDKPEIVKKAAKKYGSQAIVASIDIKKDPIKGTFSVYKDRGKTNTNFSLKEAIKYAISLNVGELLISSIDNDGSIAGYEDHILNNLNSSISLPVIINSGAVEVSHFKKGLENSKVNAVAASNVFYFTELSYPILKDQLITAGQNLRNYDLSSPLIRREPDYEKINIENLLKKSGKNIFVDKSRFINNKKTNVTFCTRCLYPSLSAAPMQFDEKGVCMGCRISDIKLSQPKSNYENLEKKLKSIIKNVNNKSEYDCIVSVSGGKDSYYQTHYITKVLGLKALLVTYNGNNYSEIGWRNLWRMREVFNCDHLVVSPAINLLKKLNRLAFYAMGDMNWHAHVGIYTTAPRIAVQMKIPLIFWGEHGYTDLSGQFSMHDFPEMNYRERTEHCGRGFDWPFFVGLEGITNQDMNLWKYPDDQSIKNIGLRQLYLGHYTQWEANIHLKEMIDKYEFEVSNEPFERTYRTGSNLDDIHENGIHDYLKYIKFGYGRCTDHASKDIRAGKMSREEGIRLVNKMDPIKSKDLERWLNYVDMTEEDFDRIADHFRDPRVWRINSSGEWVRDTLQN